MKIGKQIYIDIDLVNRLDDFCLNNRVKFSNTISMIVEKFLDNPDMDILKTDIHLQIEKYIEFSEGDEIFLKDLINKLPEKYSNKDLNYKHYKKEIKKIGFEIDIREVVNVRIECIRNYKMKRINK